MLKHFLAALIVATAAQATPDTDPPIIAQSLPAIAEPSWSFVDAGTVYFVGKETGNVTVIRADARPRPAPKPQPTPPPVVVKPVAWATLILPADKLTPEMAAWRTDAEIRKAMSDGKIVYRSYLDTESDIDQLNFRPFIAKDLGLPQVVTQAVDGSVIQAKTVQSTQDIVNAIK